MSSSRKRTTEEFEQLDAATHPVATANIEGNITSLSPVKKGRRSTYFEGQIDDGTSKLCLVGFSSDHQRKLTKLFNNKDAVSLQNCQIKEEKEGQKMEVIIKTSTQMDRSSKTFDLSNDSDDNPQTTITLAELVITRNSANHRQHQSHQEIQRDMLLETNKNKMSLLQTTAAGLN